MDPHDPHPAEGELSVGPILGKKPFEDSWRQGFHTSKSIWYSEESSLQQEPPTPPPQPPKRKWISQGLATSGRAHNLAVLKEVRNKGKARTNGQEDDDRSHTQKEDSQCYLSMAMYWREQLNRTNFHHNRITKRKQRRRATDKDKQSLPTSHKHNQQLVSIDQIPRGSLMMHQLLQMFPNPLSTSSIGPVASGGRNKDNSLVETSSTFCNARPPTVDIDGTIIPVAPAPINATSLLSNASVSA
ncbi:hypothetical protein SERLA73DRAFT_149642 [Serpula lacrymans var. lacrymans S7.3]|uniref:Uncharacterized protein n=1 Tax=Serpula lacrymans var. lacrymans (strain S7.3) TaxID=936435 RepID=F8PK22_SERL3|nr:hypothetical protein SERLA73DRAFT_149642 [Serpula lacrymans var. lacrymans S7.3]